MTPYRKPTKLFRRWQRFRNWLGLDESARLYFVLILSVLLVVAELYFIGAP